jgi:glucose/arabinose dehydrogenase
MSSDVSLPGRDPGVGHYGIVFNDKWEETRREAFFAELRQRIRDGCLYVLTDEELGALLRIEPAA